MQLFVLAQVVELSVGPPDRTTELRIEVQYAKSLNTYRVKVYEYVEVDLKAAGGREEDILTEKVLVDKSWLWLKSLWNTPFEAASVEDALQRALTEVQAALVGDI